MSETQRIREHVVRVATARVDGDPERRRAALEEFLAVTVNPTEEMAARLAELVPPLVPELYAKWAGMFADRLLETVPVGQLEQLCDGAADNDAALSLAFLMFLESERMERLMAEDLAAYGLEHAGDRDMGDLVARWLKGRQQALADEINQAKPK